MTSTHKLAAIYARVSTEEQTRGLVASLDTQVDQCRSKAAALSLPVAPDDSGLIVQEQHSGADLRWEGTAFMGLARRAERHEFSDLICLDIDRFCRGGADAYAQQKGVFTDAGVVIHYVMTDFGTMPFRAGVEALMADAAQWQRDKSREASVRNRTEWARQGNITAGNTPPFGFQFVYDPVRQTKHNHPLIIALVPHPVNGAALLHMTQHIANGGSVKSLKEWLEAQGIRTPRGAPVWHETSIRRILHNPTNYGERRSFITRIVEREHAAARPKHLKCKHRQVPTTPDQQYAVASERVTPIPGLTRELWARALTRLAENKAFAARGATLPDEQRAARGLLFGGPIRCAVCEHALKIKQVREGYWLYFCAHTGTVHEASEPVRMHTRKLDACVWSLTRDALRDPTFLERLVAETNAANGPAVRAASLRRQLDDATRDHDKLWRQLDRLDPDDVLVPDYQEKLRANKTLQAGLHDALDAVQQELAVEDARRATLAAFRDYAAQEGDDLDNKTPIERRRILLALRCRVRASQGHGLGRLSIHFDIRNLPGASAAFSEPLVPFETLLPVSDTYDGSIDLTDVPSAGITSDDDADELSVERSGR